MQPTTRIAPDCNSSADECLLTAQAVMAAKEAVEKRFDQLENEDTSLPHWADFNLFGALLGSVGKNEARRANGMTLKEFRLELGHIVEDVMETAQGINDDRKKETINTQQLRVQLQSIADAAWNAASGAMDTTAIGLSKAFSLETQPAR